MEGIADIGVSVTDVATEANVCEVHEKLPVGAVFNRACFARLQSAPTEWTGETDEYRNPPLQPCPSLSERLGTTAVFTVCG